MTADPRDPVRIRWYALVLFLAHIGVLIVGCSSLWRITNGGWSGTFAAVCFTAAYAALWAVWLVPEAVDGWPTGSGSSRTSWQEPWWSYWRASPGRG